jgi:predicted nucleic acid-binding protein
MKVLLDTNIIIHREAKRIIRFEIGQLFNWLDKLKYSKHIHQITFDEISSYKDKVTVEAFNVKLESYNLIKYPASLGDLITKISNKVDVNINDVNDTHLLNQVFEKRVDFLISEDKKIHHKARLLGIDNQVYKIESFLEKVNAENPELIDYTVLAVKKYDFGEINIKDSFFDSFKGDYSEFNDWFIRKSENICYACMDDDNIAAFLYIKQEKKGLENYSDISPVFKDKKRLKIGTFNVEKNGLKIGERFLKIVFDNAHENNVNEIYVTIFDKRQEQKDLIEMLEEWGFHYHGIKESKNGKEKVYVRPFGKQLPKNIENPKFTFPYFSRETRKYIIRIKPEYHTELFTDSINTKEDKEQYQENKVYSNRIGKVYISHNNDRHLKKGDVIVIYKMGDEGTRKTYTSTVTSICIVEDVITQFSSFDDFFKTCNRRTLIERDELEKNWWNKFEKKKPFVIKLLYAFSLPTPKPTLNDLNNLGIMPIKDAPRGFIEINNTQFNSLIKFAYNL